MAGGESMRAGDDLHLFIDLTAPETPPRPFDPLRLLTPRELRRLARRAHRLRRRNVSLFEEEAQHAGVSARRLRLLADAWAEAGASGVVALGPATPADPHVMSQAEQDIERWRRQHFPLDALEVQVWRNRVTVWWLQPSEDRTAELVHQALMQLRHTGDDRWHLYRRAVQGEWWPVVVRGRRRRQPLAACLDAVRIDALHQFWGRSQPPDELDAGGQRPDWPVG